MKVRIADRRWRAGLVLAALLSAHGIAAQQRNPEEYARFLPVVEYLDERCNRLLDEAAG